MKIDFFVENTPVSEIDVMSGMRHCVVFTAEEKTLFMRTYSIKVDRQNVSKEDLTSEHNASAIGLTEIGPSANLTVRREQWASEENSKKARK